VQSTQMRIERRPEAGADGPPRPQHAPEGASPSARADDDAAVIARSLGDPEAFAELYDRHALAIERFATRRLGAQAAEDVLAETFATAFRRRQRYDLKRPDARPWLYGIAANLIGHHRRREVRMWRALARTGQDPVAEGGLGHAEDRVAAGAASRSLARVLAELAPRDRDALLLYAWAELSYEEIAEALQIPVGTVRSRLHRARRQASLALGGQSPTSPEDEVTK
jgi:RNA polymerase sigma-70 factor, ECF subfamily